jgi:hypothetical protein
MGIFKTKFLEETWYIKFKDDDHWIEARKGDDRFYLQVNHEWQELNPEQFHRPCWSRHKNRLTDTWYQEVILLLRLVHVLCVGWS